MSEPKHQSIVTAPHAPTQLMHPMVQAAMAAGPDPATLRELLMLQRDWEQGEAKKAFTRALTALKRDLPTVINRDSVVDFTSSKGRTFYRHTSLAAVMDAVTPALTQHGFSLSWHPTTTGSGTQTNVTVSCRLTHAEGHFEETAITAPLDTSGNKSPAQGVASTITLLSRYTALSLLGIATADMPEPVGDDGGSSGDPNAVNADRNLRAMGRLAKLGKTREEAEAFVGRKVSEWTDADISNLKEWVKPREREPGSDG